MMSLLLIANAIPECGLALAVEAIMLAAAVQRQSWLYWVWRRKDGQVFCCYSRSLQNGKKLMPVKQLLPLLLWAESVPVRLRQYHSCPTPRAECLHHTKGAFADKLEPWMDVESFFRMAVYIASQRFMPMRTKCICCNIQFFLELSVGLSCFQQRLFAINEDETGIIPTVTKYSRDLLAIT